MDDYLEGELTMIKITRKTFFRDLLRSYKIIIDNIEYGNVKSGQTTVLNLASGMHTIYVKIDDGTVSNKIDFYIFDNKMIEFECGNNMKGTGFQYNWAAIAYLTRPNSGFEYLWIKMKLKNNI
ncbi:MAG: hypothetical protein ACRDAU_13735 [Clostridium sp.]